ncbi:MAG: glycosyltransferase family A protein [Candidatus Nanoarchaeia archaeon]|jgi:glycosyltransferase involved in cell wall biosynthesis
MKKPLISVIIPAYNEAEFIEKTLISLKNQKTKIPYEIIVCDNNSKDKTCQIAKKYADKVFNEKRQGGAYARNTGAKHSKGKYLVHTDADTIFPDNFIEEVYKIFKTEKYVGFCCGNWDYIGKDLKVNLFKHPFKLAYNGFLKLGEYKNLFYLPGWCICTPKKIFNKVKGFRKQSEYLEDVLYSLDIKNLGKMKHFPNIQVKSSLRRLEGGIIKAFFYYKRKSNNKGMFDINLFK